MITQWYVWQWNEYTDAVYMVGSCVGDFISPFSETHHLFSCVETDCDNTCITYEHRFILPINILCISLINYQHTMYYLSTYGVPLVDILLPLNQQTVYCLASICQPVCCVLPAL